ncbi:FKBP-type peptidyl-prolyl cis-trans isomerase [Candidatus Pacearchaeota archaeon]|nr:FKBP-type peptidyl-prolyl cis-trans isomerase [Candidatus Pacearchaeota archaeon]
MAVKKNDFIEVEFTGGISGTNEIFDTNIKADAEKAGLDVKNMKPFVLSVGHKMLPKGFDEDLEGKEAGKSYTIDLQPEDAFGKRNPQMVRMIPTKLFHEQKIDPQRGMQLSLDGQLVRILSSDRGRTLVDFNNPLAGKKVTYKYKIGKIVTDEKEKVDALQEFLFRRKFEFDVKGEVVTFKVEKQMEPFVKMFAPKFEEILGLKVEAEVVEGKEKERDD